MSADLTTEYSQELGLPREHVEDPPPDGNAGENAVIAPQPGVDVLMRSRQR